MQHLRVPAEQLSFLADDASVTVTDVAEPPAGGTPQGATDERPPGRLSRRLRALGAPPLLLASFVTAMVVGNTLWLRSTRSGLPFNIDEAGYMTESLHFGQAVRHLSLSQFWSVWKTPDIIGPFLPVVTGVVRGVTGFGPWALLATQQIFYVLVVVAAYQLARRMTSPGLAAVAAALVAGLPGIVDGSRLFYLAEPCAAMFTVLLVAQLRAGAFDSTRRSVGWGIALGLTSLTRTMVLSLLVAPVLVAGLQVLAAGPTRRRIANVIGATAVGAAVSLLWYGFTLGTVLSYLKEYGYGDEAGSYGGGHSVFSTTWWTSRLYNLVNQDVYLPILAVLVAVMVLAVLLRVAARGGRITPTPGRVLRAVASPRGVVAAVVLVDYLILSTSRNSGSYFELPLVPATAALIVSLLPAVRPRIVSTGVAVAAILASGISVADAFGVVPDASGHASVTVAGVSINVFNASDGALAGPLLRTRRALGGTSWDNCGGATVDCFYGLRDDVSISYIKPWQAASDRMVATAFRLAEDRQRQPVLFFAYQGPLLNTNTVGLSAARSGLNLPIGALAPPHFRDGASLLEQLEAPKYGQPNLVVAGTPPAKSDTLSGPGSSAADLRSVATLLAGDGFRPIATMELAAAQPITFWWKDR